MATITENSHGEIDLIPAYTVDSITPLSYMFAHLMGITSGKEREQMYKEMLKHGIQHHNDGLSRTGLLGTILHLFKQRETSREKSTKLLEPTLELTWDEEKESRWIIQAGAALDLLEEIVTSLPFYSRTSSTNGYVSLAFNLAGLPMTWKLVINEVSKLFLVTQKFGAEAGCVSSLNIRAFHLFCRLGTTEIFHAAAKKAGSYGYGPWHLVDVREDVIANLKDSLSKMPLERVIFWLKNHGDSIPEDFKKVFRIEFVRKGGRINLDNS